MSYFKSIRHNEVFFSFRKVSGYATRIDFCWFLNRDRIFNGCVDRWNFNFMLYGGTATTTNSIIVYNYYLRTPHASALSNDDPMLPGNVERQINIYIPGE